MSDARVQRRRGRLAHRCCSTTTGSSPCAIPSWFDTRRTCRSTGKPGIPRACPRTTLAVLRPTPGRASRSSIRAGTFPSWRSVSAAAIPSSDRALERKKPVGRIWGSNSAGVARVRAAGVGYRVNRAGVTWLTRSCTASGFLDSGLTVFASTPPRPAQGGRVAPGPGFGSRTSPASSARCTSA